MAQPKMRTIINCSCFSGGKRWLNKLRPSIKEKKKMILAVKASRPYFVFVPRSANSGHPVLP